MSTLEERYDAALRHAGLDPHAPPESVTIAVQYLVEAVEAVVPLLGGAPEPLRYLAVFFRALADECDAELGDAGEVTPPDA